MDSSQDRYAEMAQKADSLQRSVDILVRQRAVDVRKRRFDRRTIVALTVSLVVDLTLTIVLANVVTSQSDTDKQLQQVLRNDYATTQQQIQTRTKVLCPTETALATLLSLPRPTGAQPLTPQQQQALVAAVEAFNDSYSTLGCKKPGG